MVTTLTERVAAERIDLGWSTRDFVVRLDSAASLFWVGFTTGDRAAADLGRARIRELAETGHPSAVLFLTFVDLEMALIDGHLDEAETLAEQVRSRWRLLSEPEADTFYASMQVQVARERGQLPAMTELLTVTAAERHGDAPPALDWADHERSLGHEVRARELAAQALAAIGELPLLSTRERAKAFLQR